MIRFESEDSTDKIEEEIKKIARHMQASEQKPYTMNEKEKQLHFKVLKSLWSIAK